MSGRWDRTGFPEQMMILEIGRRQLKGRPLTSAAVGGFTLVEVVLVMALVGVAVSLAMILLPSAIRVGESDPDRLDRLVRMAVIEAMVEKSPTRLQAVENRLELWRGETLLEMEDFGEKVIFLLASDDPTESTILFSPEGFHRDFAVLVGSNEPLFYEAAISYR